MQCYHEDMHNGFWYFLLICASTFLRVYSSYIVLVFELKYDCLTKCIKIRINAFWETIFTHCPKHKAPIFSQKSSPTFRWRDATMTQNFSKGMEANFRSIFHKLMAMPESKTKLTGEKSREFVVGGSFVNDIKKSF